MGQIRVWTNGRDRSTGRRGDRRRSDNSSGYGRADRSVFGFEALPNYSNSLDVFHRDPYRPVREALARSFEIVEITDYNSDLAFVYVLADHPSRLTVRLSTVGPYAVVHTDAGELSGAPDVADVLAAQGFQLLGRGLLESPVQIWRPEVEAPVYEFLFEFDQGYPWAR